MPEMIRVGHKGADHVAPGNTVASFEAALEHGVDMIEFDVLRLRDGRLLLAHDLEDATGREALTLDEGLEHFAGEAYAGVRLNVDLKVPGYEREVVEGLAAHGLAERSLVSTQYVESLDRMGELEPRVRRGWSVPKVRRDYTRGVMQIPAYGVARVMRARLPAQVTARMRAGGCEAVMSHWLLASRRLVEAAHGAGGEAFVWTVDDAARIERYVAMGFDGVISNDPRLF